MHSFIRLAMMGIYLIHCLSHYNIFVPLFLNYIISHGDLNGVWIIYLSLYYI